MLLRRFLSPLALALVAFPVVAAAQSTGSVRGRVTDAATAAPLTGVQIGVEGTTVGTQSRADGTYSMSGVPTGTRILVARRIGYAPTRVQVNVAEGVAAVTQDISLQAVAAALTEVVVTALGQTAERRSLGTAQQTVQGAALAETQRESFVNALQGRVAGVEVISSSGVPGASSSITIRGVSSISSSNQPLMIIDGLPMDNKTLTTEALASDFPGSAFGFANRGVDFTNRAADLNPADIETLVVLKGPEASALYGIDAANGAIVITTKRGRPGVGGLEYSNSFRIESTRARPELQRVYGFNATSGSTLQPGTYSYFGSPYPAGTVFYDNVDGFFQTALTQKHNLTFSGAAADNRINYRLATHMTKQEGVIPGSKYDRINLTGASRAQVNRWLNVDLSMSYANVANDQSRKGVGGPLIGLLVWPQTDNAKDYLTAAGRRRRITNLESGAAEVDNPYFSLHKNPITSRNERLITNLGLVLTPFSWGNLRTNIGNDSYTNQNQLLRHPESTFGIGANGIIDVANDVTRSTNVQTVLNVNPRRLFRGLLVSALVGNQVNDYKSRTDGGFGRDFLEPNFVSINNTNIRSSRTVLTQRRLIGLYGQTTLNFNKILFVNVTGRNDWTSTIPRERNSFFYPSVSTSFVISDAVPAIGKLMTAKLRAAYAEVGKDARPYAYSPALEFKTTAYGGYGYSFWGPNRKLRPEFAKSYEFGADLTFFDERLSFDVTTYRKRTTDQIVNDIRGSYGTGFVLFNLNGAETENKGVEIILRGTPVERDRMSWDFVVNFEKASGKVVRLPNDWPESYVSDTWLYGQVRNGTKPGLSTRSLTGDFYLRNNAGEILINPANGLPIRAGAFIDGGYDRQPDFTVGVTNTLRRGRTSLSFLFDIRKGGDIFNATEHFLTSRGLSMRTLDRNEPRVIQGVLRDGKENTANPTRNNIVLTPAINTAYYTGISEELFIEKDVNWLRLRDVTLRQGLPRFFGRNSSAFITGTDLFLLTNYSGMDPIVNGNTAAVGGSGGSGIDFGNFPIPRGLNFGVTLGF